MKTPNFSLNEFLNYLRSKGVKVACDEFAQDYKRIMLTKNGQTFPLQVKNIYFFPEVVIFCDENNIPPPPDHKKAYDYYMEHEKSNREEQE